jgi:ribosomal protein S27AE
MAIFAGLFFLGMALSKIFNENRLIDKVFEATKETKKICNRCGRSVEIGTNLWSNRELNFDSIEIRKSKGAKHPQGDFICGDCRKIMYKNQRK